MRIQHNIAALNSYRNLTGNNSAVSKNLEKLSSGYRINRAGDDAAGLAISEKMRAQITGLNTAQKNAQDGVSLVQTAEGALTEVHSMLNRMVELADQSANGTYDNEVDRANLQKEIASLKDEIDRIADSTNFNGINLLDGSLSAKKLDLNKASTLGGQAITVKENAAVATKSDFTVGAGEDKEHTLTVEYADENGKLHSVDLKYTSSADADTNTKNIKEAIVKSELASVFDVTETTHQFTLTSKVAGEGGAKLTAINTTDKTATAVKKGTVTKGTNATVTAEGQGPIQDGDKITLNGKTYQFVKDVDTEVADGATAVLIGKTNDDTKEFLTIQTKNGNTFFLVLDRSSNTENVYMLSMIDENDLAEFIENTSEMNVETETEAAQVVIPESETIPEETEVETEKEQEKEKTGVSTGVLLAALLLLAGGIGGFYYLKVVKPKKAEEAADEEDLEFYDGGAYINEDTDEDSESEDGE